MPMPVMLEFSCYSNDRNVATAFGRFPVASFSLSTNFQDGGGKGAWRTGNDGAVTDSNPQPCSEADSPEITYIKAIFNLINEDSSTFDSSRIYTWGFSQNSMMSAYIGFCFSHLVAGIVQSGSGLVARPEVTKPPPNKGGFCKFSDYNTFSNSCQNDAPCDVDECKYWPIYPCYEPREVLHCSFVYKADPIGYHLQGPMYDRAVAEGYDSRMFVFPDGSHVELKNKEEWYAGCLGLTDSCNDDCIDNFKSCMNLSSEKGPDAYKTCIGAAECESCSPTKEMLYLSEEPVEAKLSQDTFGASTIKLPPPETSSCTHEVPA